MREMDREAILAVVEAAGVVGAGGAGFPTHVKLKTACDVLIVNGAECEPLLHVDKELLHHRLPVVLEGIAAAREAVEAKRVYLAVKGKYDALLRKIKRHVASRPWLELVPLPDIYPIGDEHILVYEVLGRRVPPRGIPLQVGAVVLNVETLYNIAKALDREYVTYTYVTVNGAVAQPGTWSVPIGTPIEEVVAAAQPLLEPGSWAVVSGGPMMGEVVDDLSQPATKTTKGLIVLPRDHVVVTRLSAEQALLRWAYSVCCQCTMCTDLCPRHLLGHPLWPHRLMRTLAAGGPVDPEIAQGALLCSECGVCDQYACFMGLSPRRVNQMLKVKLGSNQGAAEFSLSEEIRPGYTYGQVPAERLVVHLKLAEWNQPAPLKGTLPAGTRVTIPLKQHVGAPAQCHVEVGDEVEPGTLLASMAEGKLGAPVHSSIAGTVTTIADGKVVIERGGIDE